MSPYGELASHSGSRTKTHLASIVALALIGAGLTTIASWETLRLEREAVKADFTALAGLRAGACEHALSERLEVIGAVGLFYEASTEVFRDQFSRLVQPYCARYTGIRCLGWIPVVSDTDRARYELAARRDGIERFQIAERTATNQLVRATPRDRYLPIYYIEPYAGGTEMLGLDLAADDMTAELLARARDSGQYVTVVMTEHENGVSPSPCLRVFAPVYDATGITLTMEGKRKNLRGYVFGVFDLGRTLETELAMLEPVGIDFELWNEAGRQCALVDARQSQRESSDARGFAGGLDTLSSEYPFRLIDREWTIRCAATPDFLRAHIRSNHWWVLASGLVVTAALSLYLRMHLMRTEWGRRLVTERTHELRAANDELAREIVDRKQAEAELRTAQKRLVETAHRAGMADVASEVLHNVGNILNSINIATTQMSEIVAVSKVETLAKVVTLLDEHEKDLATFLRDDTRGKHVPVFLAEVSRLLTSERDHLVRMLQGLTKNVQHIKDTITTQQSYARVLAIEEPTSLAEIIEDAIQINQAGLDRHGVRLVRELELVPVVQINKQKVVQILVNLINNGKYALSHSEHNNKTMRIRLYQHGDGCFRIEVIDNGIGITQEHLAKIFRHGFTTKQHGHGFGLHSAALAAKEMGGSLRANS